VARLPYSRQLAGALALVVVGALAGCNPVASAPTACAKGGETLREAHLFTPTSGWVLTADRLLTTTAAGTSWADVTPPRNPNTCMETATAFFLNSSIGWAVRMTRENIGDFAAPLDLFATSDGGRRWSSLGRAATTPIDTPGPVYLTFIDAMRGWLVVDRGSHAGFMYYEGFKTSDGGRTWNKLAYPQSAPLLFVNQLDGFSGGGGSGAGMYATHDGGQTWAPLNLPRAGGSAASSTFQMPVFFDDRHGVLAGGLLDTSGGTAEEVFYTTADGGRSWSLTATVANPNPQTSAQMAGVMNGRVWLAAFLGAGPIANRTYTRLKATRDGGRTWEVLSAPLPGYFASEISFAGPTGWAIIGDAGCRGFKTDCSTSSGLYRTPDAGSHWVQVPLS
jgi:photosystem II stability/assembly factor-like uncharacterized protein